MMPKSNCQFNGTGGQYFVTVFIHLFIIGSITFGIYSPWAWVRLLKLKASHSMINGKRVTFTGTGGQLFIMALVQGLLTIITLGFYGPWAMCKFFTWRAQNTLVDNRPSQFTGTGGSLFVFYLIHLMILPMLTLGIYSFLGMFRLYVWKEEHSRYGGERTSFGAGFGGFFKVTLISTVLNGITLNLFTPWSMCMLYNWQISGLAVGDDEGVDHFPPNKVSPIITAVLIIIGLIPFLLIAMIFKSKYDTMLQSPQESQITTMKPAGPTMGKGMKPTVKRQPAVVAPEKPAPAEEREIEKPLNIREEIKKLDELIKKDSKNADAFYNRGVLYASKDDVAQAIIDYTKAIGINDSHGDAFYNRGLAYVKKERYEEAVRDFGVALKLNPGSADAYCNRGNVKVQLKKFASAIEDYASAMEIAPEDADLYHNRGIAYRAIGDEPNALKDAEQAAQLREKELKDKAETQKKPGKTAQSVTWRADLSGADIPNTMAEGMIHGDRFVVEAAKLENGILTIRDGTDFFPDHAAIIFLFLKDGESASGKTYNITRTSGFGSPHIHLQWKPGGKDLPQTEIFTGDYAMRLEFGTIEKGQVLGKIYLCLSDEMKSFVGGSFIADVK